MCMSFFLVHLSLFRFPPHYSEELKLLMEDDDDDYEPPAN